MREVTQEVFFAEGTERFGGDRKHWSFVCPKCKTVQCAQDYLDAGISQAVINGVVAYKCIGATVPGKGCTYVVADDQGDKEGCVLVQKPVGSFTCFDLAPAPAPLEKPKKVKAEKQETNEQPEAPAKKKDEEADMAKDNKPQTEEEKKAAARARAAAWRAAQKAGKPVKAPKAKAVTTETVSVRKPKTVRPPIEQKAPGKKRARRGAEIVVLRVGEDGVPVVAPITDACSTVKCAIDSIRIHGAPGEYKIAVVKAAIALKVEQKEIREIAKI